MSTDRWKDKEDVYVYTKEYYSVIKRNEFESVLVRYMNLEPVIQNEVSQRKMLYINAYIWNLEKWYWWTYLQGRKRDSDTENRLMDVEGEVEGGMNWESSIGIYIWPCVEQRANRNSLYSTGTSAWCSVTTWRGGMEVHEGGDIRVPMADSCSCMAESNTTL